ncbi:hypothetical protein GOP47_0009041 [Adiantum capillus-veneris]|uniref:Uncharacterized protein n=1 Tax=Adiantum capillus-veneris TaxID=13818 RepID=A0A9D4ZKX5_ADICA|nr:hypothetical protein GOP47_0009041 [Adiantum capillus-veneris]
MKSSATYSRFLTGQVFLILQLLLYAWYAIRKASVLRLPWAILGSCLSTHVCRKQESLWRPRGDYCVLERRGQQSGAALCRSLVKVGDKLYCLNKETEQESRKLERMKSEGLPVYQQYLRTGLPWAVAREVGTHDAVLLIVQGYKPVRYKPLEKVVVERWPLTEDDWKSRLVQGIPVALTALGAPSSISGTVTLVLVGLDIFRYAWMPLFEWMSTMLRLAVHLVLDFVLVGMGARYMVYLSMSWFWQDMMPSNPYTVKLEHNRELHKILVKHGFWTDAACGEKLQLEDVEDTSSGKYGDVEGHTFQTKSQCFDCCWKVLEKREDSIRLQCRFKRIAFGFGKVEFTVRTADYQRIMKSLEECMKMSMNFVRQLSKGRGRTARLQVRCWDHIDLMDTVLEPFDVKQISFRPPERAHIL